MRVHIPSLPHTDVSRDWEHCAYTMKIHRLARMMDRQGIPMFLYAGPGTDDETKARVTDVPVVSLEGRQKWWGWQTWPRDVIFNEYDPSARHWTEMNKAAAAEIADRWQPGDLLGIIAGQCQEQIAVELTTRLGYRPAAIEWGIGYSGILKDSYKVFESHAWRHHLAGIHHDDNLKWYDAVIPNSYDKADFIPRYDNWADAVCEGGYDGPLVFMARMTERKGLGVVRAIAATGKYQVITCGQGDERVEGAEHRGLVTGQAKKELLTEALAVLSPTTYLGPFEGISVEAMMAGTPAITTDWGCYSETIPERYRATTLQEFIDAIELARTADCYQLQRATQSRFGLDTVGKQYADYFRKISALSQGAGWYSSGI